MRLVLDTSALFSMRDLPLDAEIYTTPGVISELERYGDSRARYWEHALRTSDPVSDSLRMIKKAAEKTGDISRLSETDLEVLALAKDLGATILTDDYSIQNLARYLGIEYKAVGLVGIKRLVKWKLRCTGCGRTWEERHPECPVCGSPLRTSRSRK